MYDHGSGKYHRDEVKTPAAAKTQESERRGGDRHLVIASAEIVELSSGARFSTRTTDLSPGGCFVDTLTPFPVGSQVRVTIYRGNSHFETRGAVVYSQQGLGMGIAFGELEPKHKASLDGWISELTGGRVVIPESAKEAPKPKEAATDRAAIVRLVQLLISKGVLSEAEAKSCFHDPLI
jgi:hypothetical protein